MRIRLDLAYLGTDFLGWQSQRGGGTIQDEIEKALRKICGRQVRCHGAGRTDTGVHALRQTVHFDPPECAVSISGSWLAALNANLPTSIRILRACPVASSFHSRFSAVGKHYRYLLNSGAVLSPFDLGRVWHVPGKLDPEILRSALDLYVGYKDFRSFSPRKIKQGGTPFRRIDEASFSSKGQRFQLEFVGEGFYYKMVRMLVAVAVRIAQKRMPMEELVELLSNPRVGSARHVAPPDGLYLVKVIYP